MEETKLSVRETSRIITEKKLDYEPSPQGLGYEFYHSMKQNKNAIAQIDSETGETDSYGALLERCIRTSLNLIAKDITKDDIICQCSSNHLNSCVPIISSLFIGVKIALLDPSLSLDETSHLLSQVKPKIIFVSCDALNLIQDARDEEDLDCEIVVFEVSYIYLEFCEFLLPIEDEDIFEPVLISSNKETAVILFSKDTAGYPKAVCLSHYSLMVQLVNSISCWNFGKQFYLSTYSKERSENGFTMALGFATFHWISALATLNCSILTGITRLISLKFDATSAWRLIDKYEIPFITCTSYQAIQLWRIGRPERVQGKSLKLMLTTGTRLSKRDMFTLRELFPRCFITNAYEQIEAAGVITMYNVTKPEDIKNQYEKPQSCGRLVPGISCKIVDPCVNKTLGPTEPGELRYKADFIMNGYYNSDATSAFDSDGWMKTGYVAYYDEQRCFFVLDRLRDVFRYKSWHIIPSTIEFLIKEHPAVKDAVVIGIPHEDEHVGEIPTGVVTLNKGMRGKVTSADIENFVNERVSPKKRLRGGVTIIKNIPLTPTGSPKRQEVRATVIKETSKQKQFKRNYVQDLFTRSVL